MSDCREAGEPADDEAPTRVWKPRLRGARVRIHPKFDPRRAPTTRSPRPEKLPADLLPLRRRGIALGWVVAFIVAAYVGFLAAVFFAMR
jgi:hypothetical protein